MTSRILLAATLLFVSLTAFAVEPCPSPQWTIHQEVATSGNANSTVAIDYDEDGRLDLAGIVLSGNTYTLTWWRGAGDGTFAAGVAVMPAQSASDVIAADVTGDGRLDLVVILTTDTGSALWILPATGSGRGTALTHPFNHGAIAAANMDQDPEAELLLSTGSSVTLHDRRNGVFVQQTLVALPGVYSVAGADFDGDGYGDFAIAFRNGSEYERVQVYFGTAEGNFIDAFAFYTPKPFGLQTGDLDGNGKPDLVATSWGDASPEPGTITVFRNTGNRSFAASTIAIDKPGSFSGDARTLRIADVTGDQKLDLVVPVTQGWTTTLAGLGDGTFRTPTIFHKLLAQWSPLQAYSIATADFDSDGIADLAIGSAMKMYSMRRNCATQVHLYSPTPVIAAEQETTIHVQIAGFRPGIAAPLGTVSLREGGTELANAVVQPDGHAAMPVSGLTVGDHSLTAVFSGNGELAAGTSEAFVQKVTAEPTKLTIAFSATPTVHGQEFRVSVYSSTLPPSVMTMRIDGVESRHDMNTPLMLTLRSGEHTIAAKYEGSTFAPPSEWTPVTFTTEKDTAAVVALGAHEVREGTSHSLTMQPMSTSKFAATGTVTIYEGPALLATLPLVDGKALFTRTFSRAAHFLRAVYSGDDGFNASSSEFTINVLPNVPFALDARATRSEIYVAALVPAGTNIATLTLFRRAAGTSEWQSVPFWSGTGGRDSGSPTRGVLWEYQMTGSLTDGTPIVSNIDAALLFTDPSMLPGTVVTRAHYTELATAANLLRAQAGLPAFAFDPRFTNDRLIRADHLIAVRNALLQARQALGLPVPALSNVTRGGWIRGSDLTQTRDLAQ